MKAVKTDKLPDNRLGQLANQMSEAFKAARQDGERAMVITCAGNQVGFLTLDYGEDVDRAVDDLLYCLEMVLTAQGKTLKIKRIEEAGNAQNGKAGNA